MGIAARNLLTIGLSLILSLTPACGGGTRLGGAGGAGGRGGATVGSGGAAGADAGATDRPASVGCAKQLASGDDHLCILYDDGRVACLGGGRFGQLGNGNIADAPTPVAVGALGPARLLAAGGHHTCALTDGGVLCWGDNRLSELGVAGVDQSAVPVSVPLPGVSGIVQLALGNHHGCVLDGLVHGTCWGTGAAGVRMSAGQQLPAIGNQPREFLQLGASATRLIDDGHLFEVPWQDFTRELAPLTGAPDRVVANAIADDHDCVLKSGGTVWCRGAGYPEFYGVVADFGHEVAEVAVATGSTCARTGTGQVLCRGEAPASPPGDGGLSPSGVAVAVAGIGAAVELSVGSAHGCARAADGSVWCWGALGGEVHGAPQRVAAPAPSQTCDGVSSVPRPWGLPLPDVTAADTISDAMSAWAQNQCRCALTDSATNSSGLLACIQDETPLLNGCLTALGAGTETQQLCVAGNTWNRAACAAACVEHPTGLPACIDSASATCGVSGGAMAFCLRRTLACDQNRSAQAFYFQTCDGTLDCPNGFDEANCQPNSARFHCADGASSIDIPLVQDGHPDCPDGSDEW